MRAFQFRRDTFLFPQYLRHNVSDRDLQAAEQATGNLAPLISKYDPRCCYREDSWTDGRSALLLGKWLLAY